MKEPGKSISCRFARLSGPESEAQLISFIDGDVTPVEQRREQIRLPRHRSQNSNCPRFFPTASSSDPTKTSVGTRLRHSLKESPKAARSFGRTRKPPREGYLLVTVVVLIAVASLMLSRMALVSMRVATVAVEEERDLRNRWAVTSLRRFSLDRARTLLDSQTVSGQDTSGSWPPSPFLWRDAELGGNRWRLVIADESAKFNVRRFAGTFGYEKAQGALEKLLADEAKLQVADIWSPDESAHSLRWEHWLVGSSRSPILSARQFSVATQNVTLWGEGRLNVGRCSSETVDTFWQGVFGRSAPSQLHELRRQSPPPAASQLIQSLALRESQAELANQWLTTESDCFSVWIFCDSNDRVASSFYVEWGETNSAVHRGYEY